MTDRPACFDSLEQWELWKAYNGLLSERAPSICADCLPEYRDKMIDAGRCESPMTVFVIDKGGSVRGVSPEEGGWVGAVTGKFTGSGKQSARAVVAMASPEAIIRELRRRKA